MDRNIKKLRTADSSPTTEELEGAARQFVRKVSGYRQPSAASREAFDSAAAEIAGCTRTLFGRLVTS
jgi:hypothetical protein